ncbi:MAG: universal stress protein [Hyphomicrobiales bacterium]|nr:universal stress protein [Hyphomicrobiales bacterium]
MKNILAPIELHSAVDSALTTSMIMAKKFSGTIEGLALGPDLPDLVAFDMPVSWAVTDQNTWKELAEEAHQKFNSFMSANAIAAAGSGGGAPAQLFQPDKSFGDSQVASYARLFDITVLGRPGAERGDPRMATAEALIFESGRPILLAPPKPPSDFGNTVVISWNRSTETARCVALAMPLLKRAKKVFVLTVENFMVDGPTGEDLAEKLSAHDVAVEAVTRPGGRSPGEAVLEHSTALGGDLLIKGAFTQSRLRQMIFGGPTAHIMSNAEMPVFMAN